MKGKWQGDIGILWSTLTLVYVFRRRNWEGEREVAGRYRYVVVNTYTCVCLQEEELGG